MPGRRSCDAWGRRAGRWYDGPPRSGSRARGRADDLLPVAPLLPPVCGKPRWADLRDDCVWPSLACVPDCSLHVDADCGAKAVAPPLGEKNRTVRVDLGHVCHEVLDRKVDTDLLEKLLVRAWLRRWMPTKSHLPVPALPDGSEAEGEGRGAHQAQQDKRTSVLRATPADSTAASAPTGSAEPETPTTPTKSHLPSNSRLLAAGPDWSLISLDDCTRYLGVWIGPGASEQAWDLPMQTWRRRGRTIGALGANSFTRFALYRSRAESVLAYAGHFHLIPASLRREEHGMYARLLSWPCQALSRAGLCYLDRWGGPTVTPLLVANIVTLFRTARVHYTHWRQELIALRSVAERRLDLLAWHRGDLSPAWWRSSPMVLLLEHADAGFAQWSGRSALDQETCAIGAALRDFAAALPETPPAAQLARVGCLALGDDPLPNVFVKRLSHLLPELVAQIVHLDWGRLRGQIEFLPPSWRLAVLRTWVGGWLTARRMSRENLRCFFCGLIQGDDFGHLIRCANFWQLVCEALRVESLFDPLVLLGLRAHGQRDFQRVVCATFLYHSVANGNSIRDSTHKALLLLRRGRPDRRSLL